MSAIGLTLLGDKNAVVCEGDSCLIPGGGYSGEPLGAAVNDAESLSEQTDAQEHPAS